MYDKEVNIGSNEGGDVMIHVIAPVAAQKTGNVRLTHLFSPMLIRPRPHLLTHPRLTK
jgi:hypothetical protein